MLNAEHQSIVFIDHKLLVAFFNAEYHKDIFACWAKKLRLLNIRNQHISGKKNIVADSSSTQLKAPTEEPMIPLVWDYIAQKIDIREDVYERSLRKKEQEKIRYDRGVKTQYFTRGDLVLLKNSTPHLGKLTEQWRRPFIVDSFGRDHGVSYVLRTLNGEPAPNTHHGNHLHLFSSW